MVTFEIRVHGNGVNIVMSAHSNANSGTKNQVLIARKQGTFLAILPWSPYLLLSSEKAQGFPFRALSSLRHSVVQ
jgi:hypothetical protein